MGSCEMYAGKPPAPGYQQLRVYEGQEHHSSGERPLAACKNSETPTQPSLGRLPLPVISKGAISISTGNLGCPTLEGILTTNNAEQGRCYGWTEECLSVC